MSGAHADFCQVLALEPQNRQAREELRRMDALGGAGQGDALGLSAGAAWG